MISAQARPYAFERVFAPAATRRAGPQDQSVQLQDLRVALARLEARYDVDVAEARNDGFEAGLMHARGEIAAALQTASQAVVVAVECLYREFADTEARMSKAASELALATGEFLAARSIAGDPLAAIESALSRALTQAGLHEELRVHVHPSLTGPLRDMINQSDAVRSRPLLLTVLADDQLELGDVRIAWERGELALDAAARAAAIRTELASLL